MGEPRILLLDCTPRSEPSEGKLVSQFLKICKLFKPKRAESRYFRIRSKSDFLSKLSTRKNYDVIHISAHGYVKKSHVYIGNGRTWHVNADEISETRNRTKLILLNACIANRKEMVDAFDPKFFIAPSSQVRWDDAALFSILFYKKYIVDGVKFHSAFLFARKHTKTRKDYPYFWY